MDDQERRAAAILAVSAVALLLVVLIAINRSDDGRRGADVTDLNGTSWTVEALVLDGVESEPIEGTTLTASFADGDVNGSAGCNSYFGSYETEGDTLTFGPLGATRRLCPDPPGVDAQEVTYLGVLGTSERFSVDGDRLVIESFEGGQIVYAPG